MLAFKSKSTIWKMYSSTYILYTSMVFFGIISLVWLSFSADQDNDTPAHGTILVLIWVYHIDNPARGALLDKKSWHGPLLLPGVYKYINFAINFREFLPPPPDLSYILVHIVLYPILYTLHTHTVYCIPQYTRTHSLYIHTVLIYNYTHYRLYD